MSSLLNIVRGILLKTNDFCCICLQTIHVKPVSIEDKVAVDITENHVPLFNVLSAIFDNQIMDVISSFDTICPQCAQLAINSYIFLKMATDTSQQLSKIVKGLVNSFSTTMDELYESKTMYVSFNANDYTSNQFYDTKRGTKTTLAAYQRFKSILKGESIQPKLEPQLLPQKRKKTYRKEKSKNKVQIAIEDMMLDKSDQENFKCKECLKMYTSIWNLRSHFIRVHAPKVFKCPECPRKYGSLTFLETHKTESHCTVVCSECGKVFHNRHTLKMHEMGHHIRLVCQNCGRIYKNRNTFKQHIEHNVCGRKTRAHPSGAKFTCDYCNKKYTQKVSLRVHIQYEHGNYKSHECKWCKKKFWCQSRLKAHIVKHTQEKKFHCTICNGNFVTKESLLYHTRIHTGEKPYECSECGSRFLSASRRADHVKRHHSGATLYQCDICSSKFSSHNFLQKHRRTHLNMEAVESSNVNKKTKIEKYDDIQSKSLVVNTFQIQDLNVYGFGNQVSEEEIYLEVPT